jgi:hypothetical protein
MPAVNFSAHGARWRVLAITSETMMQEHSPSLPGTGLLFTSADGEVRFLALDGAALPAPGMLEAKSIAELGSLVQSAQPLG